MKHTPLIENSALHSFKVYDKALPLEEIAQLSSLWSEDMIHWEKQAYVVFERLDVIEQPIESCIVMVDVLSSKGVLNQGNLLQAMQGDIMDEFERIRILNFRETI